MRMKANRALLATRVLGLALVLSLTVAYRCAADVGTDGAAFTVDIWTNKGGQGAGSLEGR